MGSGDPERGQPTELCQLGWKQSEEIVRVQCQGVDRIAVVALNPHPETLVERSHPSVHVVPNGPVQLIVVQGHGESLPGFSGVSVVSRGQPNRGHVFGLAGAQGKREVVPVKLGTHPLDNQVSHVLDILGNPGDRAGALALIHNISELSLEGDSLRLLAVSVGGCHGRGDHARSQDNIVVVKEIVVRVQEWRSGGTGSGRRSLVLFSGQQKDDQENDQDQHAAQHHDTTNPHPFETLRFATVFLVLFVVVDFFLGVVLGVPIVIVRLFLIVSVVVSVLVVVFVSPVVAVFVVVVVGVVVPDAVLVLVNVVIVAVVVGVSTVRVWVPNVFVAGVFVVAEATPFAHLDVAAAVRVGSESVIVGVVIVLHRV
mmetsp:Transcript_24465/g.52054  ORF Transcript_24465/g.52054 Transcript_24465/m.52054 type:complete len:369 (-) Transcript_24465:263-1369(-)